MGGYYDKAMRCAVHPGPIEVQVARSSRDLPLTGRFEITGQTKSVEKAFFSQVEVGDV